LLGATAPVHCQLAGGQAGVGLPTASFARPPHDDPVAQGAQPGFWLQALYLHPLGPVYLRTTCAIASFGEKEKTFTSAGTIAGFRHDVFSLGTGVEIDPWSESTVRPFAHGGGGLYLYSGRAVDVGRGGQDTPIAREEFRFKWKLRFGVEFGGGFIVQLVPELAQLRLSLAYTTVFSGELRGMVGYEAGAQLFEYPYPYPAKRLDYLLLGLGLVFQLQ
jgi:hypothetical protein